ncbi:fts-prov protein [Capsaspora owczarzaki ATCC 30864]|uniref:Fts-prov protein n=1 Tax=Capsaspora owczarzaki (strain ATCC 30864) TaxID=595528 RepID=A0A0D2WKC9_CAPO3|nr:fts-prov protein [Capsaspora owczarzaki ATCC 30864]KJE90680.1 fts-prov protein [Capsaspora owczarzaki ATCC 30864]|eukprot:XP_004364818.1 fts-prov protein [Capsaspora owczarzaki ATCC 30864]
MSGPAESSAAASAPAGNAPVLEAFAPYFRQYALLTEFKRFAAQYISGVLCVPSSKNSDVWDGVIFVRKGQYAGGIFKFYIHFPATYPMGTEPPRIVFQRPLFHPLVHPQSNELDVTRKFPTWRKNEDHIWDMLLYLKRCFYKIETDDPANPDAAALLLNDERMFQQRVDNCVSDSKMHVHSKDESEIQFCDWKDEYDAELKHYWETGSFEGPRVLSHSNPTGDSARVYNV